MKCNIIEFYRKTDLKYQMFFKQKRKALINIEFRKFRSAGIEIWWMKTATENWKTKTYPIIFSSAYRIFYP
jgi:hypothetical protein